MKKLLTLLVLATTIISCDDGELIVTTFDFEDAALENCGGPNQFVFYQINSDVRESLSLRFESPTDFLFQDSLAEVKSDTLVITLDGTKNFVNYRSYDDEITGSYFCSSVPPTSPGVVKNYKASSGTALIYSIPEFNDNDGIDTVLNEDSVLSVDPMEEGSADLDGDGIPNYYDFDDDGDNISTARELDITADNPKPRNSDDDDIPDYRDDDDDNDGILTRNESTDGDLDPTNDIDDASVGPNYLNPAVKRESLNDQYKQHVYTYKNNVRIILKNLVLQSGTETITQQTLDMGTKPSASSGTIKIKPAFN